LERPYAPSAVLPIDSEIAVVRFVDPLAGAIRSSDLGSGWMHEWQVGQAPVGTPMGKMQQGQGFSGGTVRRAAALQIEKSPWKASRSLRCDWSAAVRRRVWGHLDGIQHYFSRGVTSLTESC